MLNAKSLLVGIALFAAFSGCGRERAPRSLRLRPEPSMPGTVGIQVLEWGNESYPDRYTRLEFRPTSGDLEAIIEEQGAAPTSSSERLISFRAGAVEGCKSEPTRRSPDGRYFAVCSPITPYEVRLNVVDSAGDKTSWSETFQDPGGRQRGKNRLRGFGWSTTSPILVVLTQSYTPKGGIGGVIGFILGHPPSYSAVHLTFICASTNSHYDYVIAEQLSDASVRLLDWAP